MSIISTNEAIRKEAFQTFKETAIKLKIAEYDAMNEMLDILRAAKAPMTAAQIEAACTSGISKHEVAGNLQAMKTRHSRYRDARWYFNKRLPNVRIPRQSCVGGTEYLTVKNGKRKAMIAEIDENGKVIPNTKREVTLHESNRYSIEKME